MRREAAVGRHGCPVFCECERLDRTGFCAVGGCASCVREQRTPMRSKQNATCRDDAAVLLCHRHQFSGRPDGFRHGTITLSFDVLGAPPSVASFAPPLGGAGTVVTIQGTNFVPGAPNNEVTWRLPARSRSRPPRGRRRAQTLSRQCRLASLGQYS